MAEMIPPTRSLRAASNPQARMQELLRRDAPETQAEAIKDTNTEKNTEKNTDSHTDLNTPSHTHSLTYALAEMNTESLPDVRLEVITDEANADEVAAEADLPEESDPPKPAARRKLARPPARASGLAPVRQRLIEDMTKEPVVRKTIDIPASLNDRLQDYCAAKRIKTERRVFLVLLENFLEEEGF